MAEFRTIWEEEHPSATIGEEELRDMAIRVLRAVDATYHRIHHTSPECAAMDGKARGSELDGF